MNMDFVKAIIDEWDPADLLAYAPKDEYDLEIQAIVQLLTQTLNVENLPETLVSRELSLNATGSRQVRIGHPSGVMTMSSEIVEKEGAIEVPSVSVQRTVRRIMDGTRYIRK